MRERRALLFRQNFKIDDKTKILDLGSENGSYINSVLLNTRVNPNNVYIADIDRASVSEGNINFGYNPVVIEQAGRLPFPDNFFDIVFCSSVIEHVTVSKESVWKIFSGPMIRNRSFNRQKEFAEEIKRVARQYFVQTPNKYFPIESHTWLPFLDWLPRFILIPVLQITNRIWVKKTNPDWNLLSKREMKRLFDAAAILEEKFLGITKSLVAIKSHSLSK